jgi:hypothetical protein
VKFSLVFNPIKQRVRKHALGPRTVSNSIKDFRIRLVQNKLLKQNFDPAVDKLIVFLTPGIDIVNGGILSISSIYEETKKLKQLHGADVVLCTIPGEPLLLRYTGFKNKNYIYRFSQVLRYFGNLESILIHVPEYSSHMFFSNLTYFDHRRLSKIGKVHINIMLQNILLLSPLNLQAIDRLRQLGRMSCTTAYDQDCTPEMRNKLGFPIHKFSWYLSPEKYSRRRYLEKENLMIVSPDPHPMRQKMLDLIATRFPRLRIQTIRNLHYEDYKELISRAKWSLTFSSGLDGYFVETIFSGGIGFAVYDPVFFTEDFRCLRTVYESYDSLCQKMLEDIKNLDNEVDFENYQQTEFDLCSKHFNYEEYVDNIRLFCTGRYTCR